MVDMKAAVRCEMLYKHDFSFIAAVTAWILGFKADRAACSPFPVTASAPRVATLGRHTQGRG